MPVPSAFFFLLRFLLFSGRLSFNYLGNIFVGSAYVNRDTRFMSNYNGWLLTVRQPQPIPTCTFCGSHSIVRGKHVEMASSSASLCFAEFLFVRVALNVHVWRSSCNLISEIVEIDEGKNGRRLPWDIELVHLCLIAASLRSLNPNEWIHLIII